MADAFAEGSPMRDMLQAGYAELSPDGGDHFSAVVDKTLEMFRTEPTLTPDDLAGIAHPALVMAGDDDLVYLPHTCALYEAMPNSQLAIVRPEAVHRAIREILDAGGATATLLPRRRA